MRREGGQTKVIFSAPLQKRERAHSLPTPLPAHAEQIAFLKKKRKESEPQHQSEAWCDAGIASYIIAFQYFRKKFELRSKHSTKKTRTSRVFLVEVEGLAPSSKYYFQLVSTSLGRFFIHY